MLDLSKSLVLVGNGPSMVGSGLGETIDGFDYVVRFGDPMIKGFEEDVGNKFNIWSRNSSCGEFSYSDVLSKALDLVCEISVYSVRAICEGDSCVAPSKNPMMFPGSEFVLGVNELLAKYNPSFNISSPWCRKKTKWASTGIVTICFLLDVIGFDEVSICGFDNFLGKHQHYYDNTKVRSHHDGLTEGKVIKDLITKGKVTTL
jgi:hypothetical protein